MADRNWEKELAEIDRRLASVPDAPPDAAEMPTRQMPAVGTPRQKPAPVPPAAAAPEPGRRLGTPPEAPGRRSWKVQLALLLRVLVGAGVVAALFYWPYPTRCGLQLAYYLGLLGLLALAGLWTSISAWRHRAVFVHLLGLVMLGGAGVMAAREILPKVGYAYPSPDHPVAWVCE